MSQSSIVSFSRVKQYEHLPGGPGGSRGIQFQKKNNRLVLLVGNKCKYTDVVDSPSTQIHVSGEKSRKKAKTAYTGGNRSLQLSGQRNVPLVVWVKMGVNRWQHAGTFRLERSVVRNDMGSEPVCWFTLRNVVGDSIARMRAAQRLLINDKGARRSKRLGEKRRAQAAAE